MRKQEATLSSEHEKKKTKLGVVLGVTKALQCFGMLRGGGVLKSLDGKE